MRIFNPRGPTSAVTAGPGSPLLHMEKFPGRNIWALVIGIDGYHESSMLADLQGCRADANDMASFLMGSLKAPPENVIVLQDEFATRTEIMKHFVEHLLRNDRIDAESFVVFYFAGHGSRDWQIRQDNRNDPYTQESVETICPYDHGICNNIYDPINSGQVHGISQPTLEGLLCAAERKGCSVVSTMY